VFLIITMSDPAATPENLVAAIFARHAQLVTASAELERAKAQLIALGKGKYAGHDGRELTVVEATAGSSGTLVISYVLDSEEAEEKARKLAGDHFRTLFDRREVFTPCEGFAHVAPKILTPAKARDIIALCEHSQTKGGSSPKAAYILGLPKAK
jgi:hypothetical protein